MNIKIMSISVLLICLNLCITCSDITHPNEPILTDNLIAYTKANGIWVVGDRDTPYKIIDSGWWPSFSNDGTKIAFYKVDSQNGQNYVGLYFYDLNTRNETRLVNITEAPYSTDILSEIKWSNSDMQLAYSAGQSDNIDIFSYDLETNSENMITNTTSTCRPSWSSDDTQILGSTLTFNNEHGIDEYRLTVADAEGSGFSFIELPFPGWISSPSWISDQIILGVTPYGRSVAYRDLLLVNRDFLNFQNLTDNHDSFFIKTIDDNNIIVSSSLYTGDSLFFDIFNISNKSREVWFKMKRYSSFKFTNDNSLVAFVTSGISSAYKELHLLNIESEDILILDKDISSYEISWAN